MTTKEVKHYMVLLEELWSLKQTLQQTSPLNEADNYYILFKRLVKLESERRALPRPTVEQGSYDSRIALATKRASSDRLESEIEMMYWKAYWQLMPPDLEGLSTQQDVLGGKYRIDFALLTEKIGVEVDGYAYHSDPATFTQDRQRQREIEADGWRIIRFSGKEVRADAQLCVIQTARLVRVFRGEGQKCW